jgi:hypothetical protein
MPGLAQARDGLDPAEDLFDSLPFALADGVAWVPGSAFIDCAGAPCVLVLRHVRCHRRFSQLTHEISPIVVLVPTQRHTLGTAWNPCCHVQRGIALGRSSCPAEPRVHQGRRAYIPCPDPEDIANDSEPPWRTHSSPSRDLNRRERNSN